LKSEKGRRKTIIRLTTHVSCAGSVRIFEEVTRNDVSA
jgi:hypothetical protein